MSWSEVPLQGGSHRFRTTRWSLIAASQALDPAGRRALEELCRQYWPPLYAFARRRGHDEHAALDLTQGFFADLLSASTLERADAAKGRFRAYLLRSFANYTAGEAQRDRAQKRGGGHSFLSIRGEVAEEQYAGIEPVDHETPEQVFERRWATTLLETSIARLAEEYDSRGRAEVFEALKPALQEPRLPKGVGEQAERLGLTVGAVKVTVHRMRRRFAEILLEEVGQTLSDGEEARGELEQLLTALARKEGASLL